MSAARPILIIEDDDALRLVLADQIAASGVFHPTTAATLEEARRRFATSDARRFDAIILDIGLPDGDGRDFCTEIRSHGHTMPIIMLTGAADENDIVSGLNAGANDYMLKPFRTTELLARLQAQLRRFDTSEGAVFTIGPYIFHPAAKLLIRTETKQRIRLTSKEVGILKFFHRNADRIVSRRVLMDAVWGYNANVESHTLETHIFRLRQKIDNANCRLLVTALGGYQYSLCRAENNPPAGTAA